jgi:glycerophosphoryl diester phosphodiesterase
MSLIGDGCRGDACIAPTLVLAILVMGCSAPAATPTLASTSAPAQPAATAAAPNTSILILAHRGGAGLAPENTLASFRNGIALGADFIEMDSNLTKDGVAVIIHDPTIDRTTDGKGQVQDLTLAQLQTFNAAAKYANGTTERQAIPTFAQVLDLAKPSSVRIEVEIKLTAANERYVGLEQKLVDEIVSHGMLDRAQISSFSYEALQEVKKISPKTKTVANMTSDYFRRNDITQPARTADQMQGYGVNILSVDQSYVTPQLIQEAHKRNIQVEVWTVDREEDMNKGIGMGVDGIISNRPDTLKRVLGK